MILDRDVNERNGIWWLASYPKSGNTWIRLFVNAAVTGFKPDINAAFQYAHDDKLETVSQLTCGIKLFDQDTLEWIWYRPAVLLNHLALIFPRDACLKTHQANMALQDIPLCPYQISKGAIYIVRDPRDVVISLSKHMGKTIDDAIIFMNSSPAIITDSNRDNKGAFSYVSSWSEHVKSWMREDNPIQTSYVRYEDMLDNPFESFKTIINAIGLSERVDDDRIRWAIEETKFKNLKSQEDERGFREVGGKQKEFFNTGYYGRWKEILTDQQIKQIETDHADVMHQLGYELSLVGV